MHVQICRQKCKNSFWNFGLKIGLRTKTMPMGKKNIQMVLDAFPYQSKAKFPNEDALYN